MQQFHIVFKTPANSATWTPSFVVGLQGAIEWFDRTCVQADLEGFSRPFGILEISLDGLGFSQIMDKDMIEFHRERLAA